MKAPTLLIVGGEDDVVIDMNQDAMAQMRCQVKLEIIPGATHLFEEPGALESVASLASDWFTQHLLPDDCAFEDYEKSMSGLWQEGKGRRF